MSKKLPLTCPSCDSKLKVRDLVCEQCDTSVSGLFILPSLASLGPSDQQFVTEFVKASGSLKVMAQKLNLSYPTVRNLLDQIIDKIEQDGNDQTAQN